MKANINIIKNIIIVKNTTTKFW